VNRGLACEAEASADRIGIVPWSLRLTRNCVMCCSECCSTRRAAAVWGVLTGCATLLAAGLTCFPAIQEAALLMHDGNCAVNQTIVNQTTGKTESFDDHGKGDFALQRSALVATSVAGVIACLLLITGSAVSVASSLSDRFLKLASCINSLAGACAVTMACWSCGLFVVGLVGMIAVGITFALSDIVDTTLIDAITNSTLNGTICDNSTLAEEMGDTEFCECVKHQAGAFGSVVGISAGGVGLYALAAFFAIGSACANCKRRRAATFGRDGLLGHGEATAPLVNAQPPLVVVAQALPVAMHSGSQPEPDVSTAAHGPSFPVSPALPVAPGTGDRS